MEIELLDSEHIIDDIWQFQFSRPEALKFDAGDYVELGLGAAGKRWLSIASSPTESTLRFISKVPSKPSEFKQALVSLELGQTGKISPAIGNFNLPPTDTRPMLWVAGGIGITPYLSMAGWLRDHSDRSPQIELIYAAKPDQHIFMDEVESVVSAVYRHDTRPTMDQIEPLLSDDNLIYLSGPQPLCEQLFEQLLERGVGRNRLKLDYFEGYDTL